MVGMYLLRNASLRDEPIVNWVLLKVSVVQCAGRLISHARDLRMKPSYQLARGFQGGYNALWRTEC